MTAEANVEPKQGKKGGKKVLKIAAGAVVVILLLLILAVLIAVPAYVSSESGRKLILSKANAATGGGLDYAKLSMSWFKGISISRLSFKDNAQSVSVAVKGFTTKPDYGALLTGNLAFGATVIDEPRVEVDIDKLKQKPAAAGAGKTEGGVPIKRIDLVVKDGDVKIKGGRQEVEVSQINSSVNLRPAGEQSKVDVSASVKQGEKQSAITAKGEATPSARNGWSMRGMKGDITIEVNELDLGAVQSILAIAGVQVEAKGVVSADINGAIDEGKLQRMEGQVTGRGLAVGGAFLNGDTIKTSSLNAHVQVKGSGDLLSVEQLDIATDWVKMQASGTVPTSVKTLEEFTSPESKYELKGNLECNVPAVLSQLPKTLGLKGQTKLTGGRLVGNVQTLSEAGQKKLYGQIAVEGLAGVVEGTPIAISEPIRIEAKIGTEGKGVKFDKLGVTSAFATVDCAGDPTALSYNAQVDLAKLASELGQFADLGKYKLGGQLASKGQITREKDTTTVVCSSNVTNLRVSPTADVTINEPNASVDVTASVDGAKKVLLVKQLKAETSFGQFGVKNGTLPLGAETKESASLTASARGVDLAKLQPYLAMSGAMAKDVKLAGVAESDVTVGFSQGTYKVMTDSTKISNLKIQSPGREPFVQEQVSFVFDGQVNPTTKSWAVNKLEVTSPSVKIKANMQQKIEGQTSSLQGNAQLDYDWKSLSGMLSPFLPTGLTLEGKRQDTISFTSKYPTSKGDQMLANLNAQGRIGFDRAEYMGLDVAKTNVDIKVEKGLLTVAPFAATVNKGQFNFEGSADFKQTPALFRMSQPTQIIKDVQITEQMSDKMLMYVNPLFANASGISGVANFSCERLVIPLQGGTKNDIDIAGTISLEQVRMQSKGLLAQIISVVGQGSGSDILTIHPTPFTVQKGIVRYDNMQVDITGRPVNFSGTVGLDERLDMSVTLPVNARGKIISAGKEGTSSRMTVPLKGTISSPKLDVGKFLQNQAVQTGLELLLEKAGKVK